MNTQDDFRKQWLSMQDVCLSSAEEILQEHGDEEEQSDRAWQSADGMHDVIYYSAAWAAVYACRINDSDVYDRACDQLSDTEGDRLQKDETLDNVMCRLSYWIHYVLILDYLDSLKTEEEEADEEGENIMEQEFCISHEIARLDAEIAKKRHDS